MKKIDIFLEFKNVESEEPVFIRADKIIALKLGKDTNNIIIVLTTDHYYEVIGSLRITKDKIENKLTEMFIKE